MREAGLRRTSFLLLLAAVSVAFAWVVRPFAGAVFWAVALAVVFAPLYRRLLGATRQRRGLAALATLLVCLVGVVLPLLLIAASVIGEGRLLYADVLSRRIDFGAYFQRVFDGLPQWALTLLDVFHVGSLAALQEKLSAAALEASRIVAAQALGFGQNAFGLAIDLGVTLYLLFFLLRNGAALAARIAQALPLAPERTRRLFGTFATVIRATLKGNAAMAAAQGTLGGAMLWFLGLGQPLLLGVLMGLLSMLPAVGAAVLWAPVAAYFLLAGAAWKGVTLIVFGIFGLGLVDNVLRPLLVGRDTQLSSPLVMVSAVGGIAVFGLGGFIAGPLIAALFVATWELFAAEAPAT